MWSIILGLRNLWFQQEQKSYDWDWLGDFFFFFLNSGTWLYTALLFLVSAGLDFCLLGREMWEFVADFPLREKDHCKERI